MSSTTSYFNSGKGGGLVPSYYLGLLVVLVIGRDYLEDRGPFIIPSSFELTMMMVRGQASRPRP